MTDSRDEPATGETGGERRTVFLRSQRLYDLFMAYRQRVREDGPQAELAEPPVWFDVVPPDEPPTRGAP
jgi:hypothetical protein